MKQLISLFCFLLVYFYSIAQDTIDVVEKTIKVSSFSRQTEYYGFAEGDKVIFNFNVENQKDIKDVTISEYPDNVKFADHTTGKVQNKILNISRNGVYVFEYYNSNVSGRTINVKIQRVPKTETTKFFNTNIKWVNHVDTIYTAQENTYLIGSDTSIVNVTDATVRVHSQTNLDNPNKTVVDFILPANTIKWTYWIGVGDEGQQAFKKDQEDFAKNSTKIIASINPLAGLAFGLITMTNANIGDNVKYYFVPSWEDALKFRNSKAFMQFKKGDVVTDFGLMNFQTKQNQKYYIGLENDNLRQGIDVNVKIVAIVVNNKYNTITEKVPSYTNKTIPVITD